MDIEVSQITNQMLSTVLGHFYICRTARMLIQTKNASTWEHRAVNTENLGGSIFHFQRKR